MEALISKYGIIFGFVTLMLTPFGLPIPEEISLLFMGVLLGNGHAEWVSTWIIGFLGVTLGDVIAWYFGRRVGLEPTGFVSRLIGPKQITDIETFYRKWGDWAIVFARQIPGMRFPTFFFAGASAVSLGRFYFIDGLSALITVNVYLWLGYAFADDINDIRSRVDNFIEYAGIISGVVLITVAVRILYKRFQG